MFKRNLIRLGFSPICLLVVMGTACSPGPSGNDNSDGNENINDNSNNNANDNGNGNGEPAWQLVLQQLPGALLSVSGTSATDVYAVGADSGDGSTVLHYIGEDWRPVDTGTSGDLWWITDRTIDRAFYIGGENGMILQFNPDTDTFIQMETPGNELIYGVWGNESDSIWAVGGDPDNLSELGTGVIWRFNGISWSIENISAAAPDGLPAVFKVWGRSSTDVYVCTIDGSIFRFDGTAWSREVTDTTRRLFTIHGNTTLTVAVGGFNDGIIEEFNGQEFENVAEFLTPQLNGVFIPENGAGVAVGGARPDGGIGPGVMFRGNDGTWRLQDTNLRTARDFHGTWVDPDGGVWAVGGNVASDPLIDGIVGYYGTQTVPTALMP